MQPRHIIIHTTLISHMQFGPSSPKWFRVKESWQETVAEHLNWPQIRILESIAADIWAESVSPPQIWCCPCLLTLKSHWSIKMSFLAPFYPQITSLKTFWPSLWSSDPVFASCFNVPGHSVCVCVGMCVYVCVRVHVIPSWVKEGNNPGFAEGSWDLLRPVAPLFLFGPGSSDPREMAAS